jgi:hypothetical protein
MSVGHSGWKPIVKSVVLYRMSVPSDRSSPDQLGDGISTDGDESRSGEIEICPDQQQHPTVSAHGRFFKSFTKVYGGSEATEVRRDQATAEHRADRPAPPKSTAERQAPVLDESDLKPNLPGQSSRTQDLADSSTVAAGSDTAAQSRHSDRADRMPVNRESSGRPEAIGDENAPRQVCNPSPDRSSDVNESAWLLLRGRNVSRAIPSSKCAVDAAGTAGADRTPNSARIAKIGKGNLVTLALGLFLLASVYVGFFVTSGHNVRTTESEAQRATPASVDASTQSEINVADADPFTGLSRTGLSRNVPELSVPQEEVPVRLPATATGSPRQFTKNLATNSLSNPPDAFALGGRAGPVPTAPPRPSMGPEQALMHIEPDESGSASGAAEAKENDLAFSNRDRAVVQRKLWLLGYNPQGVDGIFGPKSRAAISSWQDAQGLPATGYLDDKQVAHINSTSGDLYARWVASRSKQKETAASGSGQAIESDGARDDTDDGLHSDNTGRHDQDRSFSAVMDDAQRDFGRVASKAKEVWSGLWD